MKIRIIESDIIDGQIYFITANGISGIIPDGERMFEIWCDRNGYSTHEMEMEYCSDAGSQTSSHYTYNREMLKDFVTEHPMAWELDYDAMGEFYGDWRELYAEWTAQFAPSIPHNL